MMKRFIGLTAIVILVLTAFSWAQTGSSRRFLTGPYLQSVTTTSIVVMWELPANCSGSVRFGADTSYGRTATVTAIQSGGGTYVYKSLLSGLQAGTRYHYRVYNDSTMSTDNTFVTVPAGNQDFKFGVWGDSQGSNHGANMQDSLAPTATMVRHMMDTMKVDLALTTGDLAESGNSYSDDRIYFLDRVVKNIGSKAPFFIAWGNHDWGYTSVLRNFAFLPTKPRTGVPAGYGSYSFDYSGCHFTCIDYSSMGTDIPGWVAADLASTAAQSARFRFVFIHTPPYGELWMDGDAGLRINLVPLLEQYKVNACFSGHAHTYERGYLNGVYYCITGGGSWLDTPESVVRDWPHMTVGGATNLSPAIRAGLVNEYVVADIVGNTCTVKMKAFYPDGRFMGTLDSFSMAATPTSLRPKPVQISPIAFQKSAGVFNLRGASMGTMAAMHAKDARYPKSALPKTGMSAGVYVVQGEGVRIVTVTEMEPGR